MLIRKQKKHVYFLIFIIPALFFYSIFFIYPFIKGVQYSFTDWNGIVPEIPVSFEKSDFEDNVIQKLNNENAEYLKSYYKLDDNGLYGRENLKRSEINKIKRILKKIGINPIKFIGLENFKEMFNTNIDQRFMPKINTNYLFREDEELPYQIEVSIFKKLLINKIDDKSELELLYKAYPKSNGQFYILDEKFDEYDLFDRIDAIYDLDINEIENIIENIKKTAFIDNTEGYNKIINELKVNNKLKNYKNTELVQLLDKYYFIFKVKKILSKYMLKNEISFGVLGFTLFYTILNVVLSNILALLLALALEKNLKTSNVLRSIFFLPNILSLVIVGFIWSFIFYSILPKITGVQIWLGNPKLAPYLVVFVSVWRSCGYLMLIYLAGLQSISKEIIEVADIDGAAGFRKFFYVTLPLLYPAFTICVFWCLARSLKAFDIIYALVGSSSYVTNTTPIVMDIYFDAFNSNRFGYATAKALFLCLIIVFVTGIQLLVMKKREIEL